LSLTPFEGRMAAGGRILFLPISAQFMQALR
jgi:hypothetical protein